MRFIATAYFVLDIVNGSILASVPRDRQWITNTVYMANVEGQSILYEIGETVSITPLNGLALNNMGDGNIYLYNAEAQTLSAYDLHRQTYFILLSELGEWRPRLGMTENGFNLHLFSEAGAQNYQLFWR